MLKNLLLVVFAMSLSVYAGDSFLNSCQKKWNANLANIKSFRADMVQTMSLKEYNVSNSQSMKVMYLKSNQSYLRMETKIDTMKSFVICRGDSMYVKMNDGKWIPNVQNCSANPLIEVVESLGKAKLKFIKESNGIRVYRDSLKMEYSIQTKTCRVLAAENAEMKTSWVYETINDIEIPVKNTMNVKNKTAMIEIEFKNLLINQGVTKSFFEVK